MASVKISEIHSEFQNSDMQDYLQLFQKYADDERSGVKKLIEKYKRQLEAYQNEVARMYDMFEFEREYEDYEYICGIDEVGRGPLAGPVCAGAVILPKNCDILYLNDSKQLTAKKREEIYEEITEKAVAWQIAYIDHSVIDRLNILNATYKAMQTAISQLSVKPDLLLNDAVTIPNVTIRQIPIIKGDAKSASIAAASIVAKVSRDRLMEEYDKMYPEYGFAKNKGYGSKQHIEALRKYGPCKIHRKTFIQNFQ